MTEAGGGHTARSRRRPTHLRSFAASSGQVARARASRVSSRMIAASSLSTSLRSAPRRAVVWKVGEAPLVAVLEMD